MAKLVKEETNPTYEKIVSKLKEMGVQISHPICVNTYNTDPNYAWISCNYMGTGLKLPISEIDFRLRGPGSYLGSEQSGFSSELKYSSFENDLKILECAKNDSGLLIDDFINKTIRSKKFDSILNDRESKIDKIN